MDYSDIVATAKEIRKDIIRMLTEAGSGHPGGSLSCVELIVALYWKFLHHDPKNPCWDVRDRVIFSKGHVCPTLYACLANRGYFAKQELTTLRKRGSRLQGHPGLRCGLPGIETSTGSLGQGLSVGVGMALAAKLDGLKTRVYVLMGDGEQQSGQIWEAAMAAAHNKLDTLCGIVDCNGLQIDGRVKDVMGIEPLQKKWESFGWNTIEIDGHNYDAICTAYQTVLSVKGKPTVLLAKTLKGKGVSFMEDNADWHGKTPTKEQMQKALEEIEQAHIGIN